MNTEEYFFTKDIDINTEKVTLPELTEDEINAILEFIEYTRHIQEIDYLFRVFKTNLNAILFHYQLNADDTISRKINFNDSEEDFIIINALIINYISSAKTFIESIECFLPEHLGIDEFKKFESEFLNKIYDEEFSYRFLIRLRDYAQHGHLPVNVAIDKKCSFDLIQILNTPHFNHNKKIQDEMQKSQEQISKDFEGYPRIAFAISIAKFQLCILKIYLFFINTVKNKLQIFKNKLDSIINEKPDIIHKSEDILNGLILFSTYDDNCIHCINFKDDPIDMIQKTKNDIEEQLKSEQKEYDKFISSYSFKRKGEFDT